MTEIQGTFRAMHSCCNAARVVSLTRVKSTAPGFSRIPFNTASSSLPLRTMGQSCWSTRTPSNCARQARTTPSVVSPVESDTRWIQNGSCVSVPVTSDRDIWFSGLLGVSGITRPFGSWVKIYPLCSKIVSMVIRSQDGMP